MFLLMTRSNAKYFDGQSWISSLVTRLTDRLIGGELVPPKFLSIKQNCPSGLAKLNTKW